MASRLVIEHLGVATPHGAEFVYDTPFGQGSYNLMCLPVPLKIRTVNGIETSKPKQCILHTPSFPQWHRAAGDRFHNHWVQFGGIDAPDIIADLELPLNRLWSPGDVSFFAPSLEVILHEQFLEESFNKARMALYLEDLLILLARARKVSDSDISEHHRYRFQDLREARVEVHRSPEKEWTVADMARLVHLSPSFFSSLYRDFFRVSPLEDLLRLRIRLARKNLANEGLSINEVGRLSGFPNPYYFSRIFKKRTGKSPSQYREMLREKAQPETGHNPEV